ncbi:hypothetical protein B0H34DRAFT_488117 [Crassisporium funariophilum]|nr:hypothetical protein B0H34DRAFT_488117 [Crassisporium funariophilum]
MVRVFNPTLTKPTLQVQLFPKEAALLQQPINRLKNCVLTHMREFPVNGCDNNTGLDLMVFAEVGSLDDGDFETRRAVYTGDSDNRLTILNLDTHDLITYEDNNKSKLVEFLFFPWSAQYSFRAGSPSFWKLLRHFFNDSQLSGKYFLSGDRYAHATFHCIDYVLSGWMTRNHFYRTSPRSISH